jgi:hypothetical protein
MWLRLFAWLFNWSLVILYWDHHVSHESIVTKVVRRERDNRLYCHVYWSTFIGEVLLSADGTVRGDSIYISKWGWVRHGKIAFEGQEKKKKIKITHYDRYEILKMENNGNNKRRNKAHCF